MTYISHYHSPIGKVIISSDGANINGLWFENQKYFAATLTEPTVVNDDLKIFSLTKKWLDDYFNNKRPDASTLPLAPSGNQFRTAVWKILQTIPYGKTRSYGDIAKKLAVLQNQKSMSAQAVGGAVGHNPVSIIIPCHRVIGAQKSLVGYAGGIEKKLYMLKLEGINVDEISLKVDDQDCCDKTQIVVDKI